MQYLPNQISVTIWSQMDGIEFLPEWACKRLLNWTQTEVPESASYGYEWVYHLVLAGSELNSFELNAVAKSLESKKIAQTSIGVL